MMNEKKLTKKDAYVMLAEGIKTGAIQVEKADEILVILNKEIAALDKKRTSLTKTQVENLEKVEKLYEVIEGLEGKHTVAELYAMADVQAIGVKSVQHLQALVKKLKDAERINRVEIKRRAYFYVGELTDAED